jgi:hypothetical protein
MLFNTALAGSLIGGVMIEWKAAYIGGLLGLAAGWLYSR